MKLFNVGILKNIQIGFTILFGMIILISCSTTKPVDTLKQSFLNLSDSSKPGFYWYFMDGNLSRAEMTKYLESMKEVGISNLFFLK